MGPDVDAISQITLQKKSIYCVAANRLKPSFAMTDKDLKTCFCVAHFMYNSDINSPLPPIPVQIISWYSYKDRGGENYKF